MNRITISALLTLLSIIVLITSCHSPMPAPDAESSAASTVVLLPPPSEKITTVTETTTAETSVATSVAEPATTTGCTSTETTITESVTATRPQTTVTTTKKHTSTTQRSTTAKPTTTTTTATQNKPVALDTEVIAEELLRLINAEREALGLPLLNTAPIAHEIATVRAKELQIVWSHYRPDGTTSGTIFTVYQYGEQNGRISIPDGNGGWTMVDAYKPTHSSENISRGSVPRDTCNNKTVAQEVCNGFKGSPNHWADLMNDIYTGVGIGVSIRIVGDNHEWYEVNTAVLTMSKTYG